MSLANRLVQANPDATPEDFLCSSLSLLFPEDPPNQHSDVDNTLLYSSPHLPRTLRLDLAEPRTADEKGLFAHYVWNATLQLAELIERGTLAAGSAPDGAAQKQRHSLPVSTFDVRGRSVAELGAGTALASTMAALLGAEEVLVTDYPSEALLPVLRRNVARNVVAGNSPRGEVARKVEVAGHAWGEVEELGEGRRHAFDVVMAADCLWVDSQHQNLLTSISHLLKTTREARAWVVAAFHTGRSVVGAFFEPGFLRARGLEVDALWEVDGSGVEREWVWEREGEDVGNARRWQVVCVLKRVES